MNNKVMLLLSLLISTSVSADYKILMGTNKIKLPEKESLIINLSCLDILEKDSTSQSGIYKINPTGEKEFEVYCDMTTDGGGWTQLMGTESLSNLLVFSDYKKSSGLKEVTNETIEINPVVCPETFIETGGSKVSGASVSVSYSEVKVNLSWQGTGGGDVCLDTNASYEDGIQVSGQQLTVSDSKEKQFSNLNELHFSCSCRYGNDQGGVASGKVMVR